MNRVCFRQVSFRSVGFVAVLATLGEWNTRKKGLSLLITEWHDGSICIICGTEGEMSFQNGKTMAL